MTASARETGGVLTRLTAAPRPALRSLAPGLAAAAIGIAVPLSGFQPFDNAGDVLGVESSPALVIAMPATLIALFATAAAAAWPSPRRASPPRLLVAGSALLLSGALLSLTGSDHVADTFVQVITAVVAPICLFVALRRGRLPLRPMGLAFVATAAALLVRADVVFFDHYGWPTGSDLLAAKQSFKAGDFHYYGLQNPVATAIFTVTVFTFAALWLLREERSGPRVLLASASLISLLTLFLLYERIGIAIALILTCYVLLRMPFRRRWRVSGIATAIALLIAVAVTGPGATSQLNLLHTSAEVRLGSLGPGVREVVHHPLTGHGLGWSWRAPSHEPAHSSVLQAGVEMGALALVGVALLTAWFLDAGFRALRHQPLGGMRGGALVAVGVYALYTLIAGGVNAGINNGLVSVWGLTCAMLLVIGLNDRGTRDRILKTSQ